VTAPLIDKTFDGMLRQMRRDITDLQRRLGGAEVGVTPIFPDPTRLFGATVDENGTITLNDTVGAFCLIPGVFTEEYLAYRVLFHIGGSASPTNTAIFRWMVGNFEDTTAAAYSSTKSYITTSNTVVPSYTANSFGYLSAATSAGPATGVAEIINPYSATDQSVLTFDSAQNLLSNTGSTTFVTAKRHDGFAVQRGPVPGPKTTQGWLKIFGYR